jgi:hypothetical protein
VVVVVEITVAEVNQDYLVDPEVAVAVALVETVAAVPHNQSADLEQYTRDLVL